MLFLRMLFCNCILFAMTRLNAIQVTVSKHHECLTVYITVSVVLDSYLKNLNKSRSTQNVVVKQMSMTLALFK